MAKLSRYFETFRDHEGEKMRVFADGRVLLRLAATNKGTAFPEDERVALGLEGLLPPRVSTLEDQIARVYAAYQREPTPIAKYQHLRALQERNELLYYAVLERHLTEMMPIIYTPTVGEAVQQFSALYQSARGLSLSTKNIQLARRACEASLYDDVRMIVATDSSAILGIGDQGYGGLAIAIGKLALYTAGGGVSPYRSLPVGLDVGTDRADLRENPAYLGVRHARLKGEEYLAFVDKFVDRMQALKVGDPTDPDTDVGPLATESGRDEIAKQVDDAVAAGAKLRTGGKPIDGPGWFYPPTVITDISKDMALYTEEVFGPVASMYRAESIDEAIEIASKHPMAAYGLVEIRPFWPFE